MFRHADGGREENDDCLAFGIPNRNIGFAGRIVLP